MGGTYNNCSELGVGIRADTSSSKLSQSNGVLAFNVIRQSLHNRPGIGVTQLWHPVHHAPVMGHDVTPKTKHFNNCITYIVIRYHV